MQQLTRLDNGIRVITDTVQSVGSVAVGAWFAVGARDESLDENGIAHLVEHMMFKGTPHRSARKIAEEIENVGGNMNAYTSREITAYFIHLLKEDVPLATEVLADILQNASFDESELERERQVILQEIGMVQDTPDDLIFDNFQEVAFPGQSVGSPILGRPEIVSRMDKKALKNYTGRRYTPERLVISAAGNIEHDMMVTLVENAFCDLPENQDIKRPKAKYSGGDHRQDKPLEQAHIILGFEGLPKTSDQYYTAMIYATLMGGGMSSRLFQEIREERGLVYTIQSFHLGLYDDGLFGVYAGTGPDSLDELIPVTCDELKKSVENISREELDRAKSQIKADMIMDREKMLVRADQQAKYLINFNRVFDPGCIIGIIDQITEADIQETARSILSSQPTVTALGPLQKLESYEEIQKKFAA